jgi:SlyX protein
MADDRDTPTRAMESRIEALEVRCAYQDEIIDDLNKVIVEQWTKLDHMARRIDGLEDRLRDVQDGAPGDAQEEPPPPHY